MDKNNKKSSLAIFDWKGWDFVKKILKIGYRVFIFSLFLLPFLLLGLGFSDHKVFYRDISVDRIPLYIYSNKENKLYDYEFMQDDKYDLLNTKKMRDELDEIVVLKLSGVISSDCTKGLINAEGVICTNIVGNFLDWVKEADYVKGLVVVLDSPGGEAYASWELFDKFYNLRSQKPVYVFVPNMLASGGVFVASGASKVYASDSSMIGNVGVKAELVNYNELFKKLGVKVVSYTSKNAKHKLLEHVVNGDADNIETQYFQEILDSAEESFHNALIKGRGEKLQLDVVKTGLIFSPKRALDLGLIDDVVNRVEDIELELAKSVVGQDPLAVVEYRPYREFSVFEQLAGVSSFLNGVGGSQEQIKVVYK